MAAGRQVVRKVSQASRFVQRPIQQIAQPDQRPPERAPMEKLSVMTSP
jgi:hypothetical protein